MAARTLTIEFPETATIPLDVRWDQDLLRYAVAGALYARGLLSREEARGMTGDSWQVFEKKLRKLGFDRAERVRSVEESATKKTSRGRWAKVADFFSSHEAGHLDGRSDEALEYIKDFRKGFEL